MPFKGIHGHTRHTHEDKIMMEREKEEEHPKPKKNKGESKGETAIKKEVDLYNKPFEPFTDQKTAHYVNRFFRRSAQTVVHCILALSPHHWMHTDELFDWMMPYERMGALLSEDAQDYINRIKYKEEQKKEGKQTDIHVSKAIDSLPHSETAQCCCEHQVSKRPNISWNDQSIEQEVADIDPATLESIGLNPNNYHQQQDCHISSIFPSHATNPGLGNEMQVQHLDHVQPTNSKVSHFHPPFLIIDSRREDEYVESHIHGAYNIHFVPPKIGHRFDFTLPDWVEKDTPIITYCAVGLRSGLMVWELRRRGHKFARALSGGYYKWCNEGRPIYANTGELTQKVLQQHHVAGIMLRKELKSQQKRTVKGKEVQDQRVAEHHKRDSNWPQGAAHKPFPNIG